MVKKEKQEDENCLRFENLDETVDETNLIDEKKRICIVTEPAQLLIRDPTTSKNTSKDVDKDVDNC